MPAVTHECQTKAEFLPWIQSKKLLLSLRDPEDRSVFCFSGVRLHKKIVWSFQLISQNLRKKLTVGIA